jgi:hypothetical protein
MYIYNNVLRKKILKGDFLDQKACTFSRLLIPTAGISGAGLYTHVSVHALPAV